MNPISDHIFELFLEHPAVCTDSRKVPPGSLFFALQGERFDGNQYAAQALASGARYAIVSDTALAGERFIHVTDTLSALQQLASRYRKTFDIPVLGITGSNGKTTTKELISAALAGRYQVHATAGNYNNHIGVPLTILSMPQSTDIAVVEMGANHIGEIAMLSQIAFPTHGLITNIGSAHLEGFGSLDGVKQAKSELYTFLAEHNGLAFINTSCDYLQELAAGVPRQALYALGSVASCSGNLMVFTGAARETGIVLSFATESGGSYTVYNSMYGRYNVDNMAGAIAVALHFGVDPELIVAGLSSYSPANNRSQRIDLSGLVVLMDAYNANPTSMDEALSSMIAIPGEKSVILGDMFELGAYAVEAHQRVVGMLEDEHWSHVFLIGEHFGACDIPGHYHTFKNV